MSDKFTDIVQRVKSVLIDNNIKIRIATMTNFGCELTLAKSYTPERIQSALSSITDIDVKYKLKDKSIFVENN